MVSRFRFANISMMEICIRCIAENKNRYKSLLMQYIMIPLTLRLRNLDKGNLW